MIKTQTVGNVKTIEFKDVISIYSGKADHGCWCGCHGVHRTSKLNREVASKERGYAYDDEDVNDSMIRKVIALLQGSTELEWEDTCVSAVLGQRVYAIYFSPEWAEKNLTVISPILAVA